MSAAVDHGFHGGTGEADGIWEAPAASRSVLSALGADVQEIAPDWREIAADSHAIETNRAAIANDKRAIATNKSAIETDGQEIATYKRAKAGNTREIEKYRNAVAANSPEIAAAGRWLPFSLVKCPCALLLGLGSVVASGDSPPRAWRVTEHCRKRDKTAYP